MDRPTPGSRIALAGLSPRWFQAAGAIILPLCVLGCDPGSGPPPLPGSLEAVAGSDQTATVGTAVAVSPAIRVLSKKGKPLRRREVVFSVASGGGQVLGATSTTDRSGVARVGAWILGPRAGAQTLQAFVEGLPALVFTATGTPGAPAGLTLQGGDRQTGVVGTSLGQEPSVLVEDAYENPVESVAVEFMVTKGGGYLTSNVAETNRSGIAGPGAWTLGVHPGINTLSASISGLPPVVYSATAISDVPSKLTILLGDGQAGTVGTELPLKPTVLVRDRFDNLLEGIAVTFEVASGDGTIADGSQTTESTGVAVSGAWTLGTTAGTQALQVTVVGVEVVTLLALAEAGPPALALAQGGGTQTAIVGTAVADPPGVRVEDEFGNPVAGVSVTFSPSGSPDPDGSPGILEGSQATTDDDGRATAGQWILGTVAGSYRATAEVQGLEEPVSFHALATPDLPSSVSILEGDAQTAPIGTPVPVHPTVRVDDRFGNGVAEVPVTFSVLEGGGELSGAQASTDEEGVASLGSWTLGPTPGGNRLAAEVEGVGAVTFRATALIAPPAALTRTAGNNQTIQVGSQVPIPPQVRVTDAEGSPVPWVTVVYSVVSGGGSISEAETTTDPAGLASVGSWTLGTATGKNVISASVGGLNPVFFSAMGTPGPPVSMASNGGDSQSVLVNTAVPVSPSVTLHDSFGNPTPDQSVAFSVSRGGGSVTGASTTTDASGVARVGSWTLGPNPGVNELTATSAGLPDVSFFGLGVEAGGYQIELEFLTAVDPSIDAVFREAASRWQEIIVGDVPDYAGTLPEGGCQPISEPDGIDDVKVYITVEAIDGSGGVLGRAGPCYYRATGGAFSLSGIMELDEADLSDLQSAGLLGDVIIHELGHVLGFGTLWNVASNDLLVGAGSTDPYFNGLAAVAAFDAAGGSARVEPKVPVENTGGPGTRDGHWRESVHNSELMTGWIEGGGVPNPLSAITIGAMADMGYTVNMAAAEPYALFDPLGVSPLNPSTSRVFILELPSPIPIPAPPGG